jgi:thiol-disulfide isomerase/thioredoxin
MTVASLLLALVTATNPSSTGALSQPVLLDFHAHWCAPCRQVRPAVKELIHKGFPVKSINIDEAPEVAERYGVHGVPTFIVVDGAGRELDRTSGAQPADSLARFFLAAKAKAHPADHADADVGPRADSLATSGGDLDPADHRPQPAADDVNDRPEQEPDRPQPVFTNPKPWQTVVRIRVLGPHSVGFGSGTIIHSTPTRTLLITCAHIFKLEGRNKQVPPRQFPRRIMIDLFDGNLRGKNPAQVHFLETVEGEAVDYDFSRDVGLIAIRPGRQLPASRVVPPHWEPKSHPRPMLMIAMGCPEGQDATAWNTVIVNPRMRGLAGNPSYEAIECETAPKQGRSGGGLFTTDGYLAGVCNFAEPRGDHGLYATPRSIYRVLDRNNLMALYAPVVRGPGTMVAGMTPPSATPRMEAPIARSQSPDPEGPDPSRSVPAESNVSLPHPSLLGIADPMTSGSDRSTQTTLRNARRVAWHPAPIAAASGQVRTPEHAQPTNLNLDPAADHDRFGMPPPTWRTPSTGTSLQGAITSPDSGSTSVASGQTRWRAVKAVQANNQAAAADN